eukprot:CAMPEP_0169128022 /NCGR_PEP_ID=MMETSP1015-20121227/36337_1 /TAXON_ID=342587 /ORGANISM="Karlodinium micrum, Strain CCMP2283" /LENGTH=158 /DNA_ID=CAMNT_0009191879 /DNA_START=369 /DNA_END=845 /DNA_ORIENTATION=-
MTDVTRAIRKDICACSAAKSPGPQAVILPAILVLLRSNALPLSTYPFTNIRQTITAYVLSLTFFLSFNPLASVLAAILPSSTSMTVKKICFKGTDIPEAIAWIPQHTISMTLIVFVHALVDKVVLVIFSNNFLNCIVIGASNSQSILRLPRFLPGLLK